VLVRLVRAIPVQGIGLILVPADGRVDVADVPDVLVPGRLGHRRVQRGRDLIANPPLQHLPTDVVVGVLDQPFTAALIVGGPGATVRPAHPSGRIDRRQAMMPATKPNKDIKYSTATRGSSDTSMACAAVLCVPGTVTRATTTPMIA